MSMNNYKKILFGLMIIFLLANVVYALEQSVYILDLKYDNGIITKENIKVISGEAPDRKNQPIEGYLLNLISFDGEVLYSFKFNFPLQIIYFALPDWFDEQGNQIYFPTEEEGIVNLNETTLNLVIPYFPDAKKIEIYSPENEFLLEIDVGYFAQVCGDNICQDHESYFECPQDCPPDIYGETQENKKTINNIITYFKEDKVGKVIKYIIYALVGFLLLVVLREIIIKIMDKYLRRRAEKD